MYAQYGSLLFWLALVLPGYVIVRRFFKDDLRSGLLGTLSLSYLASFALLSPFSIGCYLFRAPLWVFTAICVLSILGALIEITRRGWWPETGRLFASGASLGGLVVLVDMFLGFRVGAITGGDTVVHLTRVRDLLDHGFSNFDPFVAERFFFSIYHTNLHHALYATCTQLTGVHHLNVWYASLPFGKLLIAGGAYYMTWCVYDRRWVAYVAAIFTVGCFGPTAFVVYPNKLAPLWIMAMMIGFVVQACQSPCTWKSVIKIGAASLVVGQIHSLYGAFAAVACAPVLIAVGSERILRRRPDRWKVTACVLALAGALPFLLVSQVTAERASSASAKQQTTESAAKPADTTQHGWVTMKPRSGWGTVTDVRALFLAAGIIAALVGSRRKQAGILLAIAGTVGLIFYVGPLCSAALYVFQKQWILNRMGSVLSLGFVGLVPASIAFLIEPKARYWALGFLISVVALIVVWVSPYKSAVYVGLPCLVVGSLVSLKVSKATGWWTRCVTSLLVLILALSFPPNRKPEYTWANYCAIAVAPRDERESYLTLTTRFAAFFGKHVPTGSTVLLEPWPGMVITMVHDCHIVAPERAGNGIADLKQRRRDLELMLGADTPWDVRRPLLRKYDIKYFMPARAPTGWTRGHLETLITEGRLRLYVLNTDDE